MTALSPVAGSPVADRGDLIRTVPVSGLNAGAGVVTATKFKAVRPLTANGAGAGVLTAKRPVVTLRGVHRGASQVAGVAHPVPLHFAPQDGIVVWAGATLGGDSEPGLP